MKRKLLLMFIVALACVAQVPQKPMTVVEAANKGFLCGKIHMMLETIKVLPDDGQEARLGRIWEKNYCEEFLNAVGLTKEWR